MLALANTYVATQKLRIWLDMEYVYSLLNISAHFVEADLPFFFPISDTGFLRTLDSSIKRNTAVIKKLKQINEEQREGLMEELRSVNLSKFVSEAVTAICDAKLRAADIQAAVLVPTRLISDLV